MKEVRKGFSQKRFQLLLERSQESQEAEIRMENNPTKGNGQRKLGIHDTYMAPRYKYTSSMR